MARRRGRHTRRQRQEPLVPLQASGHLRRHPHSHVLQRRDSLRHHPDYRCRWPCPCGSLRRHSRRAACGRPLQLHQPYRGRGLHLRLDAARSRSGEADNDQRLGPLHHAGHLQRDAHSNERLRLVVRQSRGYRQRRSPCCPVRRHTYCHPAGRHRPAERQEPLRAYRLDVGTLQRTPLLHHQRQESRCHPRCAGHLRRHPQREQRRGQRQDHPGRPAHREQRRCPDGPPLHGRRVHQAPQPRSRRHYGLHPRLVDAPLGLRGQRHVHSRALQHRLHRRW